MRDREDLSSPVSHILRTKKEGQIFVKGDISAWRYKKVRILAEKVHMCDLLRSSRVRRYADT